MIPSHRSGEAYEVEFLTLNGETVAVTTLPASQVRPIEPREITHARSWSMGEGGRLRCPDEALRKLGIK